MCSSATEVEKVELRTFRGEASTEQEQPAVQSIFLRELLFTQETSKSEKNRESIHENLSIIKNVKQLCKTISQIAGRRLVASLASSNIRDSRLQLLYNAREMLIDLFHYGRPVYHI